MLLLMYKDVLCLIDEYILYLFVEPCFVSSLGLKWGEAALQCVPKCQCDISLPECPGPLQLTTQWHRLLHNLEVASVLMSCSTACLGKQCRCRLSPRCEEERGAALWEATQLFSTAPGSKSYPALDWSTPHSCSQNENRMIFTAVEKSSVPYTVTSVLLLVGSLCLGCMSGECP